jgi:hypothetical protein
MGAAFNNLMEEETKESLAKMCCELMREINSKSTAGGKPYEFLNPDFLTLMNDIGRLGHEKFGADAFEVSGGARKIERHQAWSIMCHARYHLCDYEEGTPHDNFNTVQAHLAAAAFNCMLEYIFSQGE